MPTLTSTTLLQLVIAAYRTQFPMLDFFSTDFSAAPLRLGDNVMAHIRTLPGVAIYDATTGYANGALEGRDLLVDVPITVDSHMHSPVKYSHLKLIADQKKAYEGTVADQAWVLGRAMLQFFAMTSGLGGLIRAMREAEQRDAQWSESDFTGVFEAIAEWIGGGE